MAALPGISNIGPERTAAAWRRRLSIGVAGVFAAVALAAAQVAQPPVDPSLPLELRVKAAYLYNFIRFVEWPRTTETGPQPPIVIGVMGHDSFGNRLGEILGGAVVNNRPIRVRRLYSTRNLEAIDALYIARSEEDEVAHIIDAAGTTPILTISEARRFTERGGMIRLESSGNRVTFSVNAAAIRKAGLTPSSQMLQYGRVVNP